MSVESWQYPSFRDDTGMQKFVDLAKKAEWQVRDLPWGDLPPIPEKTNGSAQVQARRADFWRSVVFQQLHADMRAVQMSSHLFSMARHEDALAYYVTLVEDESRHTDAWLRLAKDAGGDMELNPHLENLADRVLAADMPAATMMMQGFFEKGIIPRFEQIRKAASAAGETILSTICEKLMVDDGIHHASGVKYLRTLMGDLSPDQRLDVAEEVAGALPDFLEFAVWSPRAMSGVSNSVHDYHMKWAISEVQQGALRGIKLGIPFDKVDLQLPPGVSLDLRLPAATN
jgi:hypothetical protein